ncbi:hypothetical protein NIIDNTM18_48710 [Mycolicibacterium litorale]|uniref:Uncharacterized protein n=1 Tax=Mycolicibacterium litorale TaxID=758802 RepID=A0A6S6P6S9_9MYCO|nr:hypothetical protein NIIDNTM18_48710 [Mycolicibacterium litorale]
MGPNRSTSIPDTGNSTAISSADTVTTISTGTFSKCSVAVAYEIANTPQVLKAAPSPQRDSIPSTVVFSTGGRKISLTGTADRSSSARTFSNAGVSAALRRTTTPKITSTTLTRNAIRHP